MKITELPGKIKITFIVIGILFIIASVSLIVWQIIERRNVSAINELSRIKISYLESFNQGNEDKKKEVVKLLREYTEKYHRTSSSNQAYYYLGNIFYQIKDYDNAIYSYQKSIKRNSKGSIALLSNIGIGFAYETKKDYKRALEAFNDAVKLTSPGDTITFDIMKSIGRMQEKLNMKEEALVTYQKILNNNPESPLADDLRWHISTLRDTQSKK